MVEELPCSQQRAPSLLDASGSSYSGSRMGVEGEEKKVLGLVMSPSLVILEVPGQISLGNCHTMGPYKAKPTITALSVPCTLRTLPSLAFSSSSVSGAIIVPLSLVNGACSETTCLLSGWTCDFTTGTAIAIAIVTHSSGRHTLETTWLHLNWCQRDMERIMCSQPQWGTQPKGNE